MNRIKIVKISIFIIMLLALAFAVSSQDRTGCCCKDGQAYKGSFVRENICTAEALNYFFSVPTAQFLLGRATSTVCTEWCGEVAAVPTVAVTECGSLSYAPGPQNLQLKPEKGKRKLTLSWQNNCTDFITHYEIIRCSGDCSKEDFTVQTTSDNYSDQLELEWNKQYTYKLKTVFNSGKSSQEISIAGSPGDLECQNQGSNSFCISPFYYDVLKPYLKEYGYLTTDKNRFKDSMFGQTRDDIFGSKYNNAFKCSDFNRLNNILACPSDTKACIAGGATASCADKVDCKEQASAKPFGLYATRDACEGTTAKKYCYYDKSHSLVNDCFECNIGLSCYDYRSGEACKQDNCGAGRCEWHDTYPLLGLGVCVDARFDNCPLCDSKGSFNKDAYNEVFDKCTSAKAAALETPDNPCFYDTATQSGKGCAVMGCIDYTSAEQCGTSQGGIQIDRDNNIIQKSNDPCGIGVCQYDTGAQLCAKNANAKIDDATFRDCYKFYTSGEYKESRGVKECERDYFPPQTDFIPQSHRMGVVESFNIRILDKKRFDQDAAFVTKSERKKYPTHICIYSGIQRCYNFTLSTVSDQLVVDNLILGEKTIKDVIAIDVLAEGQNSIRFYTEDPNQNLEVVKEVAFTACDGCQGPSLLEFNFTKAQEFGGIYYTASIRPSIDVLFSTETTLITKEIAGMNQVLATSAATLNNKFFTITSASDIQEGNYKFRIDGINSKNVPMESPAEIGFVYDATPPTVRVLVEDTPAGAEIFERSNIRLKLEFSEAVVLEEIMLVKPDIGDFAILEDEENITDALTASDSRTYSASLALPDGPNQIRVHAKDYAGNSLFDAVVFNIFTAAPDIMLKSPSFGVSATPDFDLIVETTNPAECKFWFNAETPVIPAPAGYENLEDFGTTGGASHSKNDINRISSDKEKTVYPLTVKCQSKYGSVSKSFEVMFDTTMPEILSALAYPNPVIQRPFETYLKVTTAPDTFCKYDKNQKPFAQMKGRFPGYARTSQTSHNILVQEADLGVYTYHIACITLAELGPATAAVGFEIKEGVPFAIASNTPEFFEGTDITLALETNKDALCYYSAMPESIGALIGDGTEGTSHVAAAIGVWGANKYYITCTTTGRAVINGMPESAKLELVVYVGEKPVDVNITAGICSDNILNGGESDIDCGGSCPFKCDENRRCNSDSDCQTALQCMQHPKAGFRVCAGDELIKEFERTIDADKDGLPDWWEEKYFGDALAANPDEDSDGDGLTNLEEFEYYQKTGYEISPVKKDTDGDGWSDRKEILKGYNPADSSVHPPSVWWIWLLVVLLIIILILVAGYIGYNLFEKRKEEKVKTEKAVVKRKRIVEKMGRQKQKIKETADRIRSLLRRKEEYPSVTELKKEYGRGRKTKDEKSREVFVKLKNFLEGKPITRLEKGAAIDQLRHLQKEKEGIEQPFEALIKLAVDRYSKEERLALLKKLKLLKAGLLSKKERGEFLEKLREVARYWKTNKELLNKEIQKWVKKKPFEFVKIKKKEKKTDKKKKS